VVVLWDDGKHNEMLMKEWNASCASDNAELEAVMAAGATL